MRISKKVFLYMFSIILVVSYFVILYVSINPNTSWEYKLYYIDKETEVWPGNNGYDYKIGTRIETNLENKENCKRFGKGWGEYAEEGLWSKGEASSIYFGNLPSKDLKFEIKFSKCLLKDYIEVYFNNRLIEKVNAKELVKNMKIAQNVNKEDITDGRLIVTLRYTEVSKDNKTEQIVCCKGINLYEI